MCGSGGGLKGGGRRCSRKRGSGSGSGIRRDDDLRSLFQSRQNPLNLLHELPPLFPHDLVSFTVKSVGIDEELLEVVGEDGGSRGSGWWGEKGVKLRLEGSEGGERRGRKRFEKGGGTGGGLLRRLRGEEGIGKSQKAEAMDREKPKTKKIFEGENRRLTSSDAT